MSASGHLSDGSLPLPLTSIRNLDIPPDPTFMDNLRVLYSAEVIQARIQELAAEISRAYRERDLVLVPILRGSVVFAVDLMRHLTIYPEIEFISASSYGNAMVSSGRVNIHLHESLDLYNKHVLIVEDIVDTGRTLKHIAETVQAFHPASLRYVSMLYKDLPEEEGWPVDWYGFRIPNTFVVGYGLDYQQRFRNLPYIAELRI